MKYLIVIFILLLTSVSRSYAADVQKGLTAAESGNCDEALKEWIPLSEEGNPIAQYYLGTLYYMGFCVIEDYTEALKWFSSSADQGYAKGQNYLGQMYDMGYGITQDSVEAMKWYHLAAKQGDNEAQYNLGFNYKNGRGVMEDKIRAHMWFNIAASKGNKDAREAMEKLRLSNEEKLEAQKLAKQCLSNNYEGC